MVRRREKYIEPQGGRRPRRRPAPDDKKAAAHRPASACLSFAASWPQPAPSRCSRSQQVTNCAQTGGPGLTVRSGTPPQRRSGIFPLINKFHLDKAGVPLIPVFSSATRRHNILTPALVSGRACRTGLQVDGPAGVWRRARSHLLKGLLHRARVSLLLNMPRKPIRIYLRVYVAKVFTETP